jgi:hypothetical protein
VTDLRARVMRARRGVQRGAGHSARAAGAQRRGRPAARRRAARARRPLHAARCSPRAHARAPSRPSHDGRAPHEADVHPQAAVHAAALQAHEHAIRHRRPLRVARVAVDAHLRAGGWRVPRRARQPRRSAQRGRALRDRVCRGAARALLSGRPCSSRSTWAACPDAITPAATSCGACCRREQQEPPSPAPSRRRASAGGALTRSRGFAPPRQAGSAPRAASGGCVGAWPPRAHAANVGTRREAGCGERGAPALLRCIIGTLPACAPRRHRPRPHGRMA